MINIDYYILGAQIKAQRLKLGLTQEKIAEILNVTNSFIYRIEKGKSIPSLHTMVNIAAVLNMSLDTLFLNPASKEVFNSDFFTIYYTILEQTNNQNSKNIMNIFKFLGEKSPLMNKNQIDFMSDIFKFLINNIDKIK